MGKLELGIVLPMEESWTDGATPRWVEIRELALRAEAIGFEAVWIPGLRSYWTSASGISVRWKSKITMRMTATTATVARTGSSSPARRHVRRSRSSGG